ncbi:hypothetical protein EGN72_01045 [Pseudorhodobacter sp. E13]|uniref:hypothetical protein n=1 Tax=Pseudorhodobacter sp. E13 TaxID=2487931 RepID=UPI000F8C43C6|nr:hypothetical protein [Pseudorhodobacter sp. E13]RUS65177.1 hypothetical protein EGN72_01045 [Pseudorhodobacter sp. E13]
MYDKIEKLDRAEIERAEREGECLGRNPDGGKIIDYVGGCGGYFDETNKKAIARLLYVEEPPIQQKNRAPRKTEKGETYGSGRWERLRMGRASFHPREAQFVHDGLCRTHGEAWARAFPAEELVRMSFEAFLERVARLGLQLPLEHVPPFTLFKVLAALPSQSALDLRVVDPTAPRLGGPASSRNRNLKASSQAPEHRVGEQYVLQVRNVRAQNEQLFVFEIAADALLDEETGDRHQAFPIRSVDGSTTSLTIQDDEEPFEFFDIKGRFCFVALAFPSDWDFVERFSLDPSVDRWGADELRFFATRVGELCQQNQNTIRLGVYEYELK